LFGGATAPVLGLEDGAVAPETGQTKRPRRRAAGGAADAGARVHAKYYDRHEEYVPVTRDDLREIRAFGWMQQSLFGVGTFFFSGAFWVLVELLAHQEQAGKYEFTAWMGMCVVSMTAGTLLAGVGLIFHSLRQRRLDKYFREEVPAPTDQRL
jgi:hypothetical protein